MRLSDAIRLGALLKPQGFDDFQGEGVSCAIGAAFDAVGLSEARQRTLTTTDLTRMFSVTNKPAVCPCNAWAFCHIVSIASVFDVAIHLNDHHRWTREAIADWVETQESPVSPSTSEPHRRVAVDPVVRNGTEGSTRVKELPALVTV